MVTSDAWNLIFEVIFIYRDLAGGEVYFGDIVLYWTYENDLPLKSLGRMRLKFTHDSLLFLGLGNPGDHCSPTANEASGSFSDVTVERT